MVRTEPLVPDKLNPQNAIEFEDYLPKHEKIEFNSGESEKIVPIYLFTLKIILWSVLEYLSSSEKILHKFKCEVK